MGVAYSRGKQNYKYGVTKMVNVCTRKIEKGSCEFFTFGVTPKHFKGGHHGCYSEKKCKFKVDIK